MRVYLLFLILIITTACNHNTKTDKKRTVEIKSIIKIDTLKIKIPSIFYDKYTTATCTAINGRNYIVGLNQATHSVDFIDLAEDSCFSINIKKQGPQSIRLLSDLCCTDDGLLIKGNIKYYWINYRGQILEKIDLRQFKGINTRKLVPFRWKSRIVNFDNISYNQDNGTLYESLLTQGDVQKKDYYDSEFIVKYDLDKKKASFLPFKFPELLKTDFWGDRDKANITIGKNQEIVFNFPFSSAIWCFDNSKKLTKHSIDSEYTGNLSKPSSYDDLLKHPLCMIGEDLKSLRFLPIKFDKYRDLYYRIHVDKAIGKHEKRLKNRRLFFSIISSDFKKISEFKLPKGISESDYFILDDGVYFPMPLKTEESHEYMRLLKLSFKKQQS